MPKNCPYAKEFNLLVDYFLENSIMRNQEKEEMMKRARGIQPCIDFETFFTI